MLAFLKRSPLYDAWVSLRLRREVRAWLRRGRTPPSPHLVKQQVLRELAREYHLSHLVETGTYMGTMLAAMQGQFARVDSVELDPSLARRAARKFARLHHVHVHQGNSGALLRGILDSVTGPALFWLDAHHSGGITAKGDRETPIADELALVLRHPLAGRHVIAIDDARLFDGTNDYPRLEQVRQLVAGAAPLQRFDVADDIIRITPATRPPAAARD